MLFFGLGWFIILIYFLAAIIPPTILLVLIYKQDKIEKEPGRLLFKLIIMGALSALAAMIVEKIVGSIIDASFTEYGYTYVITGALLGVALVEEGLKFIFMRLFTWRDRAFDHRFDGIVYAAFVSLGFAALENILYVFGYGLSVAPLRAVLAIPAHGAFSIYMGFFYGRAKEMSISGRNKQSVILQILGVGISVILHGLYDACLMIGEGRTILIFVVFVILMFVVTITFVMHQSKHDRSFYER